MKRARPWLRYRINESNVSYGLRALLYDSVCSQVMDTLTGGAFLVAFALLLGASNTVVGLLAAISPITQMLQLPAIYLVDRLGSRKRLVVYSSFFSRIFWFIIPIIPWIVPSEQRLPLLLVCLFFYFGLASVSACGFNPWVRDFVPESIMGRYFGKCLAAATAASMLVAVLAGAGVEMGKRYVPSEFVPYGVLFILGGLFGLVAVYFLSRIPEPRVTANKSEGIFETLAPPLRDINFRRLLIFLGTWFFAINLAGPFYAVYMLKHLELPMGLVVGFSVLGQIMSVISFRIWGSTADSFSNKSVLFVCGHLYIISVILWPLLALSQRYFLMIPLLMIIHILTGISAAGASLCTANIVLKAAPQGKSTPFLALNTLMHGVSAAAAPVIGGLIADWLTRHPSWSPPHQALDQAAILSVFPGSDFLGIPIVFFLTAILATYAMHRLRAVHEEGTSDGRMVIAYVTTEMRKALRHLLPLK